MPNPEKFQKGQRLGEKLSKIGEDLKNQILPPNVDSSIPLIEYDELNASEKYHTSNILGHAMKGKWNEIDIVMRIQNDFVPGQREYFTNIIKILSKLKNSETVGNLLGVSNSKNKLVLIFKHYKYGSLIGYVRSHPDMGWKELYKMGLNIAKYIKIFHDHKIIANNINPKKF